MLSDEELIIKIPKDEPEVVMDDDTPIEGIIVPELQEPEEEAPQENGPRVMHWPAVKIYHPMLGQNGDAPEIPESHKYWAAASLMLGPAGHPLREGNSSLFLSGMTGEDIGEQLKQMIINIFKQMDEQMSTVKRATMNDVPPVREDQ